MSDFDSKLGEALSENGSYDESKATQQRQKLREKFRAGALRVERITTLWMLIFTAVGAYGAGRLIMADDAQDAVLFGVVLFVMVLNQKATGMWYWAMNVKISVLKELKLLRLSLPPGRSDVAASEESDLEELLRKPLAHGGGSGKLEEGLRLVVLVAAALGCAFVGVNHAQRKAQMAAMSAKEVAIWRLDSSDTVKGLSQIRIDGSSQLSSELLLTLPYSSGEMESVRMNGQDASFETAGKGKYQVPIPFEFMMEDIELEAKWRFPFAAFERGKHGYRTVLKAMVPVRAYRLKLVIEDASRYELSRWMAKGEGTPFFAGARNPPKQVFGSCGLGIISIKERKGE